MQGPYDDILERLATHPVLKMLKDHLGIDEDEVARREVYDNRLARIVNLVTLRWPDFSAVASVKHDVKRKREVEAKPWPGFELR